MYQVNYEFLNENGEWVPADFNNDGAGFTYPDAADIVRQITHDSVCIKRNIEIKEMQ